MSDVFVVRDDVSRAGLRRVHLIRGGAPVDEAEAMERYGLYDEERRPDGASLQARLAYEEEDVKMWHLRLYWREDGR